MSVMCIYSNKLAHIQVVVNCPYSVAQMCTREDTLAHNLGALYFVPSRTRYNILFVMAAMPFLCNGILLSLFSMPKVNLVLNLK